MSNDLAEKVSKKLTDKSKENISLAKQKCAQADKFILQARSEGSANKEIIKEALQLYTESLELYSRMVQPYIGIAYISYSAGNIEYAIGILNKAIEIEPENPQVKEMLTLFNQEYKQKNISEAVSKVAGKSLSEKLKASEKKTEFNIFEKISAIFVKSTKRKNAFTLNEVTISDKKEVSPSQPTDPGNFFENMKNISANKQKK